MSKIRPTTATRLAFLSLSLLAIAAGPASAATSTWTAAGATSNFSDAGNWDAFPTPNCIMVFPAGAPFAAKGAPVNDLTGQTIDQLNIHETYVISGNPITCKNINDHSAGIVTVSLPISTEGSAVLTVSVLSATGTLNLAGRLSGAGPVTYGGPGTKRLNGSINNTLTGQSSVALGTLVLDSTASESIAGPLLIDSGAVVRLMRAPEIRDNVVVTVNGTIDLSAASGTDGGDTEVIGGLAGGDVSAIVALGANALGCSAQVAPTVYLGAFSGTGGFRQSASGIQVIAGTSQPYTGTTRLAGGSLHLWGQLLGSPVVVSAGTLVMAADCSVGAVTLSGSASVLSFEETISAMTMRGTTPLLTLGSGSRFHVVTRSPTDHARISTAAASLAGAVLSVDTSQHSPTVASVMLIIDNTGSSPIAGTFAGLPEGATVASATNSTTTFTISYVGGSGNDVTLTGMTVASDVTGPAISAMTASAITGNGATITWTTDEAADSQVEFGQSTAYGSLSTLDAALVTTHSVGISGLLGSTAYHYRVLSRDADGNRTTSADGTFTTTADTTGPLLTMVTADGISATGTTAQVSWVSDEPSDSQVIHGLTASLGTAVLDGSLVTVHGVALTGLIANTTYHYRVTSTDAAGNAATSADATFTTSTTPVVAAKNDDDNGCGGGSGFGMLILSLMLSLGLIAPGRSAPPRT